MRGLELKITSVASNTGVVECCTKKVSSYSKKKSFLGDPLPHKESLLEIACKALVCLITSGLLRAQSTPVLCCNSCRNYDINSQASKKLSGETQLGNQVSFYVGMISN